VTEVIESSYKRNRRIALKTIMILTYPIMIPIMLLIYFPMSTALNYGFSESHAEFKEGQTDIKGILKMALRVDIG
jgi:hypothetical protein